MSLQLITTVRGCETKAVCVVAARERLNEAKRVGLYVVVRKLSTRKTHQWLQGNQLCIWLSRLWVGGVNDWARKSKSLSEEGGR